LLAVNVRFLNGETAGERRHLPDAALRGGPVVCRCVPPSQCGQQRSFTCGVSDAVAALR